MGNTTRVGLCSVPSLFALETVFSCLYDGVSSFFITQNRRDGWELARTFRTQRAWCRWRAHHAAFDIVLRNLIRLSTSLSYGCLPAFAKETLCMIFAVGSNE